MNTSPESFTPSGALLAHSQALAAVVENVGASTLAVLGRGRVFASAVVWRDGLVVTAAHVFRRTPAAATFATAAGETLTAALVGIDSSTDLALFRLPEGCAISPVVSGGATGVRAGHVLVAVGRDAEGDLIASAGIVNRAGGAWQTWLGGHLDRLIRLDGGIYEGLSGAPVADAAGSVIGIATSALSRSYGVVVPAATISRVVDALLAHGRIARPRLGIGAQPVPLPSGEGRSGLLVTSLLTGGTAEQAGLFIGDIVVEAAGTPVADLGALRHALAAHVGASVTLAVLRGGVAMALACSVGEWSDERSCH